MDGLISREYEEVSDALIFWRAVARLTTNTPAVRAYAEKTLIRLEDKADRLVEEREECGADCPFRRICRSEGRTC